MIAQKLTLIAGGLYACVAVALGAFGAHGLRSRLEPRLMESFETGVRYQFYHALALILIGVLMNQLRGVPLRAAATCLAIGVLLFSGSIYLLATRSLLPFGELRGLGPVTPLGGLLLIVGWALFVYAVARS